MFIFSRVLFSWEFTISNKVHAFFLSKNIGCFSYFLIFVRNLVHLELKV